MDNITLHLTPEELAHLHEATEYHFQHSKLARDKARLYGRVITKLEAAQEPQKRHEMLQTIVTIPGQAEAAYGTYTDTEPAPESPQMDTALPTEAEPPQRQPRVSKKLDEALDKLVGTEDGKNSAPAKQASSGGAQTAEWPQPTDKAVVIAPGDYHKRLVEIVQVYDSETIQVRDAEDGILLGPTFSLRQLEEPDFMPAEAKGE